MIRLGGSPLMMQLVPAKPTRTGTGWLSGHACDPSRLVNTTGGRDLGYLGICPFPQVSQVWAHFTKSDRPIMTSTTVTTDL